MCATDGRVDVFRPLHTLVEPRGRGQGGGQGGREWGGEGCGVVVLAVFARAVLRAVALVGDHIAEGVWGGGGEG